MPLIKLTYRFVIDADASDKFSREVLNLSYEEFKMKSQTYNLERKFTTFSQMKANDGRANSLHYKCSFAIAGLMETINKKIPRLIDQLSRPIEFDTFGFEVIESDINDPLQHKVAVLFITAGFNHILSAGDQLVLQKLTASPETNTGYTECITVKLCEGLAVTAFQL